MSFPSIPPGGEDVSSLSQARSSSQSELPRVPPSILKTTAKSSSTVISILKKTGERSSSSSKKVSFNMTAKTRHFEKYLEPLEDSPEDHEGEEDDIDEETKDNTFLNEDEGSRVQTHRDFFIPPGSKRTRSFEQAEQVSGTLSPLPRREHRVTTDAPSSTSTSAPSEEESGAVGKGSSVSSAETAETATRETSSGLRIGEVFLRITTSMQSVGGRLTTLLRRIGTALTECWASIRSNRQNMDSGVVLVSVNYDPNISSTSLETLSD